MSDVVPPAAAPPQAPPPAPASKRPLPVLWQLALGFFAPAAILLLHEIGLRFRVGALGEGGSRVVSYAATCVVSILCALGLWMWSGRRGWRWIRVGIVLFLVCVALAVAWLLSVVFGLFAHH